jgi:hypothetical protein
MHTLQITATISSNPGPTHEISQLKAALKRGANIYLIVHLTHSRPPPPVAGQLVAGRGIASCPSVAVNGGGTGESTGIAG